MDIFTRRLAMGAAGAAGGDKTYVNDVYQSHLYDGQSANRSIGNGIKLGTAGLGYGVQFDGHTDYLSLESNSDFNFGTGDFTIEFWALSDSYSGSPYFCDFRDDGGNTGTTNRIVWYTSSSDGKPRFWLNGSARITAINATTNGSWAHYALVRSSGTTTMYIGGVSQGTYSDSTNYGDAPLTIGQRKGSYASQSYDGKISDFRIVKGTAVYTAPFSPPTKALTNITNTKLLCCNQRSVVGYTVSPVPITPSTTDEDLMSSSGPFTLSADEVKGGLVWIKNRKTTGYGHFLFDTVRGIQNAICANLNNAQFTESNGVKVFNADGFDLGDDTAFNTDNHLYQSYTFAKSPGFFDVVTISLSSYSTNQRVSHSLGCIPGLILLKNTTMSENWYVYHRELGRSKYLSLNGNGSSTTSANAWGTGNPTSTDFGINTTNLSAGMPSTYVAYVFGGGESEATGARCVDFDANGAYLSLASSPDLAFGTGDFTIEFWQRCDGYSNNPHQLDFRVDGSNTGTTNSLVIYMDNSGITHFWLNGSIRISARATVPLFQWQHVALVRNSSTTTLYLNGISQGTYSDTTNYGSSSSNSNPLVIGQRQGSYASNSWDGRISNLRIVKGTAVYTTAFRPSTAPLKNITNTKLLCCNSSTETDATVTPGTITRTGAAYEKSGSPFDDPEGFKFGEGGDQNILKCGQYTGNGSTNGPDVYVGWEPQWLLIKRTTGAEDWYLVDPIRTSERQDMYLDEFRPNNTNAEGDGAGNDSEPYLNFTPTGFKCLSNSTQTNNSNDNYIYIAIRREDGYVGKPPTIGSEVFTPTFGTPGAPMFLSSGHVVDYALQKSSYKSSGSLADWTSIARLVSNERLETNQNLAEQYNSYQSSDYQSGWSSYTGGDGSRFAWLFKRHAGMDVVTWEGNSVAGRQLPHSLNSVPEMIWAKMMTGGTNNWAVYHKGLNNGTNPQNWSLALNNSSAENGGEVWQYTAPTSTYVTLGAISHVNINGRKYIAMLFSSVAGISKVGYYDGSDSEQTITTGFQPRFVIIKGASDAGGWIVLDTVRGWGVGNDKKLEIDTQSAQSNSPVGAPTATGFTVDGNNGDTSRAGRRYIYYAHA